MYKTILRWMTGCLLSVLLLALQTGQAHEIRPAVIDLTLSGEGHYELAVTTNLEAMIAGISPEHDNTNESPNADVYNRLREQPPGDLTETFREFRPQFLNSLSLTADGQPLSPGVSAVDIPPVGDTELARDSVITLEGTLPAGTDTISWSWAESFGANALRVTSAEGEEIYTAYLQPGDATGAIDVTGTVTQGAGEIFVNYLVIGFEHILPKGLDHILFVVGLFLLSTRLAPLLWQVTSFTLAHTVTLALGMLGIVTLPANIVEPLIALSIVYVCVENLLSRRMSRWRPLVVFGFGLLHGLGFASVLTEIGLSPTHFVTGLIAFNVGVELGQITVIALCFLAVGLWFRQKDWYRQRITNPASVVIATIAAWWVFERTLLG